MWEKDKYTKKEINRAGKAICDDTISDEEKGQLMQVVDDFRAAHAFPMNTFAINLKEKVRHIPTAVVVQRLKRMDTILYKLKRLPKMKLSRMQDLGGCRVIVPRIEDVYSVVKKIRNSRIRHIEHNYKDYIAIPNPNTGYRGYHLIYKYNSDRNDRYNGFLIEIQIRTKLQHLWATAVETVGLLTDNGLKFNEGSDDWREFFKLTSALFSFKEDSAVVDGVPVDEKLLFEKWISLEQKLDVITTLGAIGIATYSKGHVRLKKAKRKKEGYYLIKLNLNKAVVEITEFENVETATEAYNVFEREKKPNVWDGVLVSAKSYETLVDAYPNYFFDITDFLGEIRNIFTSYDKM